MELLSMHKWLAQYKCLGIYLRLIAHRIEREYPFSVLSLSLTRKLKLG